MLPNLVICRQIYGQQNNAGHEILIYLFFIEFIFIFWAKFEGFFGDTGGVTNTGWALESRGHSGIYGIL